MPGQHATMVRSTQERTMLGYLATTRRRALPALACAPPEGVSLVIIHLPIPSWARARHAQRTIGGVHVAWMVHTRS